MDILHLAAPCRNVPVTFTLERTEMPKRIEELVRARLAALAKAKGMTQQVLAKRSGVSQRTVGNVLNPEIGHSPKLSTLERVARGLKVSFTELLAEDAQAKTEPLEEPHLLAQQLGELTENFLLCSDGARQEILRLAREGACARREEPGHAP